MTKTTSFVLGLIGGIFGFISAILVLFIGGIATVLGDSSTIGLGISAMLASIVGIIGASIVKHKNKISGWVMIISAVWGIVSISAFYILPGLLLLLGGILALIKEKK